VDIGNTSVQGHGLHFSPSLLPSQGILDDEFPLVETPEVYRSIVHRPEVIVDFLEPYIFASQNMADVDAITVPPEAAIAADQAHFPMGRVLDGRQRARH
jgi:hypothetical protein